MAKAYKVRDVLQLENFRDPFARYRQHRERRANRPGNSPPYRAAIRRLPCSVVACDTGAIIDPHHLKTGPAAAERAFGRRASDLHLVPLCRIHHEELESWPGACEPDWFWDTTAIRCHALAHDLRKAWDKAGGEKDNEAGYTAMRAVWVRFKLQAVRDLYWRDENARAQKQPLQGRRW